MLICTYKLSDELMKVSRHALKSVNVAYRLPIGSEVHAAVSAQRGSPEVEAVGRCVPVEVSGEVPHSESNLIATDHIAVIVFILVE